MSAVNLKNITIQERATMNGDTYFLIKDNDQDEVYFCFQNKLKDSWNELVNNWQEIKEEGFAKTPLELNKFLVELEYKENGNYKQVISLYTQKEGEIVI